jgi:hypothetical protein
MNQTLPIPTEPDVDSCAPTTSQIYVGLGWTKDIIVMRCNDLTSDSQAVFAAARSLSDAFDRQSMASVKAASEALRAAATALEVTARKIGDDGAVLARKSREHLNRRPRP